MTLAPACSSLRFLFGLTIGALVGALVGFLGLTAVAAQPPVDRADNLIVGRRADGTQMTPVNQLVDPAGTQIELPGLRPQVVASSPDGRLIATSGRRTRL